MSFGSSKTTTNQNSQFQQQQQNQQSQQGTSSTNRNLLPQQAATAPDIFSVLHGYMMNPQAAVNPARMAARDQVNQNYSGLADRVRQQFLTTGGGASGKAGQAELQGELGRSGALANVDNSAAQQAAALPLTAASLAEQFLGINLGQSTNESGSASGTADYSGTSSGSSTSKGSNWGFDLGKFIGGFAK